MISRWKNFLYFFMAVLIGIFLGTSLIYFSKQKRNYVAVVLNNGSIYFGKLSTFPRLKLNDVLFLQIDQNSQASIQRFKDAFWQPKGSIYLNRNSILFIAPVDENSSLINLIEGKQPSPAPTTRPSLPPVNTSSPVTTTPLITPNSSATINQ